jgi:hypothetical protein
MESADSGPGNRILAVVAIVAAVLVLVVSFIQGPPESIPAAALGWAIILYLERAAFIALVILGVGGVIYRLLTGSQVKGTGGGPVPSVDVEEATKPTEVLKQGVDEDVKDLNDRLLSVEKQLETLQPAAAQTKQEE